MNTLVAIPNVSAPCVTTNPCTCPVYGPGGYYLPIEVAPGQWQCALALESPPSPSTAAAAVPTLAGWASILTVVLLACVALRSLGR